MDYLTIIIIAFFIAFVLRAIALGLTSQQHNSIAWRSQQWRIEQLERKLDLLCQHLGLEEQIDTHNLILLEVPSSQKIAVLKAIRQLTGLGLKDAKHLIESAPISLSGMFNIDVVSAKQQLEAAGAIVTFGKRL
jgi:ribosomal protein L7/L12